MTVKDAYVSALGILAERTVDSDLEGFAPGWTNLLLAESLAAENSIRLSEGRAELASPPVLAAPADEIPYAASLAARAIPCGLAAFLYEAADDGERAADYRARFVQALYECSRAVPGGADVY